MLVYFKAIFGNLVVIWHIFVPFWYIVSRNIWQPCSRGSNTHTLIYWQLGGSGGHNFVQKQFT
jgi:hypothetical protein